MHRQGWFTMIGLLIILFAIGTVSAAPATPVATTAPPNIVFIFTDDLSLDEIAYMPKLKTYITNQGTSFSNYFVSVSLCCPSRTTTLRGQYSHNDGVETNGGGNGGFETAYRSGIESSTIATWLEGGDYRTGLFGKYLNGYPDTASTTYIPPGWSDFNSSVKGDAYGEYNYTLNENGTEVPYAHKAADYGTTVYTNLAVSFIKQSVQDQKPFFVYLAVYAPHQPATPAMQYTNLFPGVTAPHTPNYNEADVSDKPHYISRLPLLSTKDVTQVDNLYRKRLQSLQSVDDTIETVYNLLQADGQLNNTYIVFASDNGFHLGNHRMVAGKQTAYEEDIHLPLIVRGPRIAAGKTIDQMVGNIDLAPTFASMAGVPVPDFVDGRSFLPLLLGQTPASWRDVYLVEHWAQTAAPLGQGTPPPDSQEPNDLDQLPPGQDEDATATPAPSGKAVTNHTDSNSSAAAGTKTPRVSPIPEFHGLRGDGYVFVLYTTGEKEFYNIRQDPYELTNLASKLDPTSLQTLTERTNQLAACKGDTCRMLEDEPLTINIPSSS